MEKKHLFWIVPVAVFFGWWVGFNHGQYELIVQLRAAGAIEQMCALMGLR